jgi:hypothetical protein
MCFCPRYTARSVWLAYNIDPVVISISRVAQKQNSRLEHLCACPGERQSCPWTYPCFRRRSMIHVSRWKVAASFLDSLLKTWVSLTWSHHMEIRCSLVREPFYLSFLLWFVFAKFWPAEASCTRKEHLSTSSFSSERSARLAIQPECQICGRNPLFFPDKHV